MDWNFESMNECCGGGIMGGMWFFWLILLIVIFFVIKQFGPQSKSSESAMEVLKKRYARDEINKDEFEEIKKTLLS